MLAHVNILSVRSVTEGSKVVGRGSDRLLNGNTKPRLYTVKIVAKLKFCNYRDITNKVKRFLLPRLVSRVPRGIPDPRLWKYLIALCG